MQIIVHSNWIWVSPCIRSLRIQPECRKKLKKKLWLLLFFMVVTTYYYHEKVHRTMCTTIVLYLFNICTFKIKKNIFKIFKNGTKTPKPFFLIKHSLLEKKLKPATNDQIWLVVTWYRFFIRWPPFQDTYFRVVPRVAILYRFDNMLKLVFLHITKNFHHYIVLFSNTKPFPFFNNSTYGQTTDYF